MPKPLVSIILPTRNGARHIRTAIDSILSQTHDTVELIVVDDGSTDETWSILTQYASSDTRLICVRNKRNVGLPRALNIGFSQAKADFLTWSSDDNYYLPTAIELMINHLREAHADVVFAGIQQFNDSGESGAVYWPGPIESFPFHNVAGACFLYKRRVHQELDGYDPTTELAEDYDFFLRAYCRGYAMTILPEVLYWYRKHEASLTSTRYFEAIRQRDRVIWRHLNHIPNYSAIDRSNLALELARRHWRRREHLQGFSRAAYAFWMAPVGVVKQLRNSLARRIK